MKKEIKYSTPKQYQPSWNKFVTMPPGKNVWACKRLKGNHDMKLTKEEEWKWNPYDNYRVICRNFVCTGCGHKDYTIDKIPLEPEAKKESHHLVPEKAFLHQEIQPSEEAVHLLEQPK